MQAVHAYNTNSVLRIVLPTVVALLGSWMVPAFGEEIAEATTVPQSKKAAVELTQSDDHRMQLLNDVVAPSYRTLSPEAAKVRAEIMDDMEHTSEPEPFCYYPI